jgi:ABC-type dipeptide/oligopeptide/nickel transport system ATPase subunit
MNRTFDDRPAVREKTPLLVGLVGPSGSGKTFSALRLADGIQRVAGGETFFIDTEARRALHYAEKFKFRHIAFGQPFSPLDYLAAIEHCLKKGAKTIVIDSMSHEHEGPGGVLEMHEQALDKMAGNDFGKRDRMTMLAWAKPKAARRRLINSILQMECNFVFCFRAKQKIKMVKGKDPEALGFQPIAGEEFVYELTLKCLLMPGANGVPTWQSDMVGEKAMIKLPEQFKETFSKNPPPQLTEDIGETLAKWAAGSKTSSSSSKARPIGEVMASLSACSDPATFRALQSEWRAMWPTLSKPEKAGITELGKEVEKRITAPPPEVSQPAEEARMGATG